MRHTQPASRYLTAPSTSPHARIVAALMLVALTFNVDSAHSVKPPDYLTLTSPSPFLQP